jgi:hypothetical protein
VKNKDEFKGDEQLPGLLSHVDEVVVHSLSHLNDCSRIQQGSNIHMFIRQHHCGRTFLSSGFRQSHYETLGVPRTATSAQIKVR